MNLVTLAGKNLRHRARSYAAFFLSSTSAVLLFFLYLSLLDHPRFAPGTIPGTVRDPLVVLAYIVALFCVVFILYTNAAYLKTRSQELGLLMLVGMRVGEIARTVHAENALVCLSGLLTGVGLGTVFAKLFFLGISRMLDLPEPISFRFSPEALGLTCLLFAGTFGALSLYNHVALRRLSVAELLRGAAKPTPQVRLSWWRIALCVGALGTAYILMLTSTTWDSMSVRVVPVLGLLLVGTYFLFTQGVAAVLGWLQRSRRVYYRDTNLLVISRLTGKMQANARLFFVLAMLTVVVLFPLGYLFVGLNIAAREAYMEDPGGLLLVGEPAGVGPERAAAVLQAHGLRIAGEVHLPVLTARNASHDQLRWKPPADEMTLMSASDFARWTAVVVPEHPGVTVEPGRAALIKRWGWNEKLPALEVRFGEQVVHLPLDGREHVFTREAFPTHPLTWVVAVVDDATFAELLSHYGAAYGTRLHGYNLPQWTQSGLALLQLEQEIGLVAPEVRTSWTPGAVTGTVWSWKGTMQAIALSLFLGCFVTLLFKLVTGNIMFFKLFNDLKEDRRQFTALHKLGVGEREVRRVVTTQTLLVFFAPVLVAQAHTAALVIMLDRAGVNSLEPLRVLGFVFLGYLALQTIYWLVTRRAYVRALVAHW